VQFTEKHSAEKNFMKIKIESGFFTEALDD
jgi:hypothetical protein